MKIDLIVPTYNRQTDIEKFIRLIYDQDFEDYNVYILDDHSSQDIKSLIPNDSRFHFIRLPENRGQAYLRNVAIESSSGEILVSLDDDAWFLNQNALSLIHEYFIHNNDIGCLMFDVQSPLEDFISRRRSISDCQIIGSHITCGCAYRRKAMLEIGGFSGFFHSMAEETDISLKLINKGYKLMFAEKVKVFHDYNPSNRPDSWYFRIRYNTCRNDLMIVWLRFPASQIPKYFFGKFFGHIRFSIKNNRRVVNTILITCKAFIVVLFNLRFLIKKRDPLSIDKFKNWLVLRW